MTTRYEATPIGNLVVSYGSTSALCSESYKAYFTCSVCGRNVPDEVVSVTCRRERLYFHLDCANQFSHSIENALMGMGYNFSGGVAAWNRRSEKDQLEDALL